MGILKHPEVTMQGRYDLGESWLPCAPWLNLFLLCLQISEGRVMARPSVIYVLIDPAMSPRVGSIVSPVITLACQYLFWMLL